MSSLDARLGVLRGTAPPIPHNARTLAALTANPSCDRRSLLDAAGIDKDALAAHLSLPRPLRKSQLALDYGIAFERKVTAQGGAPLVPLLRQALGLSVPEVSYEDVNSVGSDDDKSPLRLRRIHTRSRIRRAAHGKSDPRTLLDHPVLRLTVAGHQAYLEPDVIAFQREGVFYVVEIKSFPVIHGQPDPIKAAAALTQAAAYVLALRELLAEDGLPPERVSDTVVLVNPRNFTRHPTATPFSAHKQIKNLSRHLGRLRRLPELLDKVPPDTTFDLAPGPDQKPTRPRGELVAALATVRPNYTPGCRHHCDLAFHCRTEARNQGRTAALGTAVRDDLAGIDSIATARALADGHLHPSRGQKDLAQALRHAQRIHADLQTDTA
ncbi:MULTISPECIES: hypothetical protein [unclassified Streptomyces]|uniref:hypothetical protein n=1 Tax=unclassified Streptomyces TaxID=2593676 RepID=UPI000978E054|nr:MULTISPECIES: hypothetical protein [unclassified Streptomyces]ONI48797.1 hypothetical protein STIB_70120 [Streptomyces sp. IB2014 011-1]RDV47026.1 hypothetical protein DDV98_36430 [Streptomyces sp. IB2014 011-12]